MIETTPLRKKLLDLAISGKLVPKTGEWKMVKLGEVIQLYNGFAFKQSDYSVDGKYNIINIGCVQDDCFCLESAKKIGAVPVRMPDYCNLSVGDVLISLTGNVGRTCVVTEKDCLLNQRVAKIVSLSDIDSRWFRVVLKTRWFQPLLEGACTGTAQKNLSTAKFLKLEIPLPPLAEQKAIVKRLEELLALEREIAADSAALDDLITAAKRRILDLAVSGKLVPKTGEWQMVKLGEVFQHNTGKALNRKDMSGVMMPYLTTSNVYWDRFELETLKKMPFTETEIEKCSVRKGDLLVCEGGDIGRANIWENEYSVCCQNHLHRLRPIGDVIPRYGYYVLMHYKNTGKIQGKGIGLQGLSSKVLHNLEIPLPPLAEQKAIVKRVEELFGMVAAINV